MRIETFGLPGSGKSTLVSSCLRAQRAAGLRAVRGQGLERLDQRHARGHAFAQVWNGANLRQMYHLAEFLRAYPDTVRFFQDTYVDRPRNIAQCLSLGADLSKFDMQRARLDWFWVDEGFLHYGVHALLVAEDWDVTRALARVEELSGALPFLDMVIYTKCDAETGETAVIQRMEGQGKAPGPVRRRFDSIFGGIEGMRAREAVIDAVVQRLRQQGVPVIEVAAHQDVDGMVERVIADLDRYRHSTTQG